ncbi:MAG: OmpA family protein, partial [Leptospirales bacterium]
RRIRSSSVHASKSNRSAMRSFSMTESIAEFVDCYNYIFTIPKMPQARKWLKRIVVEGYTDQRGSYLFNLNLSLQRSQRVLCVLLDKTGPGMHALTSEDEMLVRDLFFVGGYSFNQTKKTRAESRRVDLRFEFYKYGEPHPDKPVLALSDLGSCSI